MKKEQNSLSTRDEAKLKWKHLEEEEAQMVNGVFKNYECAGGSLELCYKKYKGSVKKYKFFDGEVYTIPLGLARHLNSNCWYPVHNFTVDANGKSVQNINQKIHRYGFSSLEFMDIDEGYRGGKEIIQVSSLA